MFNNNVYCVASGCGFVNVHSVPLGARKRHQLPPEPESQAVVSCPA